MPQETEERVASETLGGGEESDYLSFDHAVITNISVLDRSIARCRRILKKARIRNTYIELAAESTEWRHPRARRKREEEDGDRASARRGGKRRRRRVGSSH